MNARVPRVRNLTHEHVSMELPYGKVAVQAWLWLDLSMVMQLGMRMDLKLGAPHKPLRRTSQTV